MPMSEVSQARTEPQPPSRESTRHHRRGRGGRNRTRGSASRSGHDTRISQSDASRIQPSSADTPITASNWTPGSSRGGTINRGTRGRRGQFQGQRQSGPDATARNHASRPHGRRAFRGHLSSPLENNSDAGPGVLAGSLNGDAPEFVPGRLVIPRTKLENSGAPTQPNPKPPKSTADDLGLRIHEDITNFNYECAICTDDVLRTSQIWSCAVCWTVVHLKCVKKWYANQEKQQSLHIGEPPQREFNWRCPGCNSKLSDDPGPYHCWCGKDINPTSAPSSLPPHSCGQTCSKPRSTCPHPCSIQCHAGPCPPCDLVGLPQFCFCGKNETRKLCRETDYENGWSCQEVCGDLFPCGEHFCSKPCHTGLCGECDTTVEAKCYCGQAEKLIPCYERDEPQLSYSDVEKCWFEGVFTCNQPCQRSFDCDIHKCSKTCHSQEERSAHCPYSPDSVTYCPCQKTPLEELLSNPRSSCEDVIPHCDKLCNKKLPCGHLCMSKCHIGDCGFCNEIIDISCICTRTTSKSVCHQGHIERPVCMRLCQANLSCGRHKCSEHCCSGEKKAAERQAARRKHKTRREATSVEAEHICIKTCGRELKCGVHECQQMCHRGPCPSCPEAIFTEISCDCGHPAIEHNCHSGDVPCPKCPFLVERWCACGKEKLHSQPCHIREARCGKACGEMLKCGLHTCKRSCHRAGECEDSASTGNHCEQPCGKKKLFCEHLCQNTCHGQTLCNESLACTAKASISCPCGLRQQQVKCLASSMNPTPSRPGIKCDDECLRLDRNRRLAAALNIDPASHQNDHVPYTDLTLKLFKENKSWAESQEREFRVFAKSPDEARLRFKPMASPCRQFLHNLAKDYGLESKSEDAEPHRYVVVFKSSRFVSAPLKTLSQCLTIRATQAAAAGSPAAARALPRLSPRADPFNGFLLINPRFGVTIDEVASALQSDQALQPSVHFKISFLPSEEILLRATTSYSAALSPTALEQALTSMKGRLAKSIKAIGLAGNVLLCHVDSSGGDIIRRDNFNKTDASGWSAVAGRGAVKLESVLPVDEPVSRTGKLLIGVKKKQNRREHSWTEQLDGDVEC